jgi:cellulose synthase/poly-beta-1,6-N-acetylglucosamine synthase-like glycosyltransferase
MLSIVITSFNEPKTIGKAITSFVMQKIPEKYELYVVAPDKPTLDVARTHRRRNKNIKLFVDPGKGKSYALNLLLPKLKGGVIILSDGDVYVSEKSVSELIGAFKDPKVGCVTGRPVSTDNRNTLFGYWSHLLCDAGAHEARMRRAKKGKFLECSGYLWAFRNNILNEFPKDVAEDTIIPYLFAEKGYKIAYIPQAKVYVKYPTNLHDFVEQKKRTAKGHETLSKYVDIYKFPRTKSFLNEIKEGYTALFYPRTIKEIYWTLLLFPLRLYIWILVFFHTKVKKQHYQDAWKRVESTK